MYTLKPDEKTTPVILYTKESVIRGEVVTKQSIQRISIWPRTDGVPKYMHLLKAQLLIIAGGPGKALLFSEIFFPTSELIGFHILPPTEEPLDFDPTEGNRMMVEVDSIVGTFNFKGKMRISTQSDVGTSLEVARISWLSLYDVVITNPHLPQMQALHVPMVLVNPARVAFGITEPI